MEKINGWIINELGNDTSTHGSQALNPDDYLWQGAELDSVVDGIQSSAVEVDRLRSIPLFRLVCLGE